MLNTALKTILCSHSIRASSPETLPTAPALLSCLGTVQGLLSRVLQLEGAVTNLSLISSQDQLSHLPQVMRGGGWGRASLPCSLYHMIDEEWGQITRACSWGQIFCALAKRVSSIALTRWAARSAFPSAAASKEQGQLSYNHGPRIRAGELTIDPTLSAMWWVARARERWHPPPLPPVRRAGHRVMRVGELVLYLTPHGLQHAGKQTLYLVWALN